MSISGSGRRISPKVAAARVREWARVKALTVFSSIQRSRTSKSRPSTNSRWSGPVRMCSTPSSTNDDNAMAEPLVTAMVILGASGRTMASTPWPWLSRTRTKTSVMVSCSPSMLTLCPARGAAPRSVIFQVRIRKPAEAYWSVGARSSQPLDRCGVRWIATSPMVGCFQITA